jgi:hypothetical protein
MHAAIEEEIFYPQMRTASPALVEKSLPEHDGCTTSPTRRASSSPTRSASSPRSCRASARRWRAARRGWCRCPA